MVSKEKWDKVKTWMKDLQIQDNDLIERFIVGSGRGGQKLHKTASTVYLNHKPTGIEVKCQESRSREENRYFARVRLCAKLQATISDEKTKEQQDIEKIKRQKKRRSRRSKLKMLDEKTRRGRQKLFRKKIQSDE
ncbi:MAG: peptide chain release factor-like protein [Tatlockia sp.]|nr:peptide chain release factor-like protein [Tatlockia sp.]